MPRILLLPLDERPCNLKYPVLMCEGVADADIIAPSPAILGKKKRAADTAAVSQWVMGSLGGCDAAVISIDMLVYGGIVPSRLHELTTETCMQRLALLKEIRKAYPKLKLYAFNLIMRTPAYSSSEEEPDYYAQHGRGIFECAWYKDKSSQMPLTQQEQQAWEQAEKNTPEAVREDYARRRHVNHAINLASLDLVKEGVLDFLVIPLDDCAQYGWSPSEQRVLRKQIIDNNLGNRVYLYSGADEVGSTLTARAVNQARGKMPRVYVHYSATQGPLIIPKYEDRLFGESMKWQIVAAGGLPCASVQEADWVLMANAPTIGGERMGEAGQPLDASYYSQRCLPEFMLSMKEIAKQKPVVLSDTAMANGADDELMSMLAGEGILGSLLSYAGWNTAANAAGTCISHAMLRDGKQEGDNRFLAMRILEDWGYMVHVRQMALDKITALGGGYFDLNGQDTVLSEYVRSELSNFLKNRCSLLGDRYAVQNVTFPWDRLFEIDFQLDNKV